MAAQEPEPAVDEERIALLEDVIAPQGIPTDDLDAAIFTEQVWFIPTGNLDPTTGEQKLLRVTVDMPQSGADGKGNAQDLVTRFLTSKDRATAELSLWSAFVKSPEKLLDRTVYDRLNGVFRNGLTARIQRAAGVDRFFLEEQWRMLPQEVRVQTMRHVTKSLSSSASPPAKPKGGLPANDSAPSGSGVASQQKPG